jgi:hypothetical protein
MSDLTTYVEQSPGVLALRWWRAHETEIVLAGMIVGGLTLVGFMWALVKAAPIAGKLVMASKYGIPVQAVITKAGLGVAAL